MLSLLHEEFIQLIFFFKDWGVNERLIRADVDYIAIVFWTFSQIHELLLVDMNAAAFTFSIRI